MKAAGHRALALLVAGLALAGCAGQTEKPPLPAAENRLVLAPVSYSDLPGWSSDRLAEALPVLKLSCDKLQSQPDLKAMGADGRAGRVSDWLGPCGALRSVPPGDDQAARAYFEQWFQPYRALAGARAEGLFTGYCEAELHGAWHKSPRYRVPLYARPSDLKADAPYDTRAEIEAGALNGRARELLWVDDAVDAHILHIQGSGRVLFEDGSSVQVGYAGNNGRPFVALGRILRERGKLAPDDVTMPAIRAWLKSHPAEAPSLMAENPRYVFFRILTGPAPLGAAGVPLTPGRSLAVDPAFIGLGTPIFLVTADPDGRPIRRLMVAQDIGAAIKGPVRGDIFFGAGEPAFDLAGRMKSQGTYTLLLPRWHSAPVALAGF